MMTVEPPAVHPSLGLMAFMHGVATGKGGYKPTKNKEKSQSCQKLIRGIMFGWLVFNILTLNY